MIVKKYNLSWFVSFLQKYNLSELKPVTALGELRHAKATLKLPLGSIIVTPSNEMETKDNIDSRIDLLAKNDEEKRVSSVDLEDKESEENILPTPSCTGSMDSLSSSNSSLTLDQSRQRYERNDKDSNIEKKQKQTSFRCDVDASLQDIIHCVVSEKEQKNSNNEKLSMFNHQYCSTDEDSGIENLKMSNSK